MRATSLQREIDKHRLAIRLRLFRHTPSYSHYYAGIASFHCREVCVRILFLPAEPGHIKRWQEDQREDCTDEQPTHDGESHRTPEYRRRDRYHAENRRDCGQHDRTE